VADFARLSTANHKSQIDRLENIISYSRKENYLQTELETLKSFKNPTEWSFRLRGKSD
jgi:hypothetical protein